MIHLPPAESEQDYTPEDRPLFVISYSFAALSGAIAMLAVLVAGGWL